MNYYGRNRRYRTYSRASRTYRRSSRFGSSAQRRAAGNYRAALQQRDSTQVNLSIPTQLTAFSAVDDTTVHNYFLGTTSGATSVTWSFNGVGVLNIWDLIRKSTFYQSYAAMYDQVKLDRIRVKLTPAAFLAPSGANYSAYTVVTAWDRTGLSEEQLTWNTNTWGQENGPGDSKIGGAGVEQYGLYCTMNADDVSTYSSAVTKPVTSGSNASIVRTLYPRTTAEKSYYCNTADIDKWYDGISNNHWYGIKNEKAQDFAAVINTGSGNALPARGIALTTSYATQRNPAFVLESPNIPFKPTLLVGLLNKLKVVDPADNTTAKNPTMSFYVEADIGVTFRGLRKAPLVQ